MPTYTSPFTGDVVQPTDVSYYSLTFSTNQTLQWPNYIVPGSSDVVAARIIDCTPSQAGLFITLPPGNQGSVGNDILFRNRGSFDFVIRDISGDQTVTVGAGTARYFYLVDNSTEDGIYRNFTYGAGTSVADAASLVGSGLTNQLGKLETSTIVNEINTPPTLDEESRALAYVWTGGSDSINLPDPSTLNYGWFMMLRNGGTGTLGVVPHGSSTIDGQTTLTMFPSDSTIITFDYATQNFFTVGLPRTPTVTFSAATYDVSNIFGPTLSLVSFAPTIQDYVDFSGVRTAPLDVVLPAITQIYVISNSTPLCPVSISISGSPSSPAVFGPNVTAILLSDGVSLTILSQSTTNTFYANSGTAVGPSFSFSFDASTGMYLVAANVLGLAANGVNIMTFDANNIADLVVTTQARFNAKLISGGTF